MDTTTIIIIGIVVILALYFFNRSRVAPRGTYDDKKVRSSGSIGGDKSAYDDPKLRSSGSIGGTQRGHDSPAHDSSGSIGTDATERRSEHRRPDIAPAVQTEEERRRSAQTRKVDDDKFKSGGSFGGS